MLIEFEAVLKQYNPEGLESLEAPLLQKERESLFHELGVNDSDLREIFSWRNGCAEDKVEYTPMFEFSMVLCKLEDIVKYKKENIFGVTEIDSLLLVFANQEEGFLFNYKKSEDYGRIHLYSVPLLSIDEPLPYYDSLTSMIKTHIEYYRLGILSYRQLNSYLEMDIDAGFDIYNKYNPISRFFDRI